MRVGDDQLDAAHNLRRRSLRRKSVQKVLASEGPMSMPRTSRLQSALVPVDDDGERDDTPLLAGASFHGAVAMTPWRICSDYDQSAPHTRAGCCPARAPQKMFVARQAAQEIIERIAG